jgi:hypothetical protein
MEENYIKAPYITQPITIHKGKVPRFRRASKRDVPPDYRKGKYDWLKNLIFGPKHI